MNQKTLEVKKYYDAHPYPSRTIIGKKHITKYSEWILKKTGLKPKQIKNKKVLEAGCGTGELSISFSLLGAKTIGVDISKNSIKIARKKAKKFNSNTVFLEKNIYDLNLGRFDFVFSLGVLHHTENPEKAFNILAKHTKKNGVLCIGLYHKKGRIKQRIKRLIVQCFKPLGFQAQKKVIELIYGKKQLQKRNINYVYDKFLVPIESYHTEQETENWFKKNNFSKPRFFYPQKSFFIATAKKN